MVQTLREEATQIEKAEFLRQLLPMQSVTDGHENIVSLIGVSLDEPPYLAILEFCGNAGDLKTFLINATGYYFLNLLIFFILERKNKVIGTHVLLAIAEPMSDLPQLQLSFCRDIIRGLAHLHDVLLIPLDLGARTCQVTQSLSIKVKHTYLLTI